VDLSDVLRTRHYRVTSEPSGAGRVAATAASAIAEALGCCGVEMVFGVTGGHVSAIFDGLHRTGPRAVTFRDERSAAFAAAAWGALTRRPGVCLLTAGPGLTNGITGLIQAHHAGWPVVSVAGRFETPSEGFGGMQELAQDESMRPWSKVSMTVRTPANIVEHLYAALHAAVEPPRGHVHLSVPVDLLTMPAPAATPPAPELARAGDLDPAAAQMALDLLGAARKPALILGPRAWMANPGEALGAFLEKFRLPVFSYDEARGMVPDDHPLSMGDVLFGQTGATKLLRQADVVLALGSQPDWRLSFLRPPQFARVARIIQISDAPNDLSAVPGSAVRALADPARALERLAGGVGRSWPVWLEAMRAESESVRQLQLARAAAYDGPGVHPLMIATEVQRALEVHDANAVIDGGHIGKWAKVALRAQRPGQVNRLKGPFAAIGHGLPSAIVRKLSDPLRATILITGDGSFGYSPLDLDTARREHAPIVVVVAVDGAWGSVLSAQESAFGHGYGAHIEPLHYDKIAKAIGADGVWTPDAEAVRAALDDAVTSSRTAVIAVPSPTIAAPARYSAGVGY
jgi:acetolactate synthase-1/2/3 large subunit